MEKHRVKKKPAAERTEASMPAAGKPADRRDCEEHREKLLDEALEQSFPASDTPSILRTGC